jgi:hypothetical protein
MCSHPSTSLPEIWQQTHSPANVQAQHIACRGKYSSCRSVSYTRGVARHGIRNALPQAQHLDTAHYVAIAQNRGFSLARRVRTVSVTASSHSDRPKLALTALDRDRRAFWELKQAFCPTNKTMFR